MTKNQKSNLLNQITISDRQKETQKIRVFNAQSIAGKCIVEPCNYTKQMDVYQATRIEFKDDIIMEILSKFFFLESQDNPQPLQPLPQPLPFGWLGGIGFALAVVNDAFHWICMSGDYDSSSRTFYLVSFSISNEVYTEMSLPKKILGGLEGNMLVGVSVLDGMLCAYSTYGHASNRAFEIWVLKDYGVNESWNSLFIIHKLPSLEAIPKRFADGEVLFWVRHVFHKMRHSIMTLIGPFRIPDAIGNAIGFVNGLRKSRIRIAFTESLISPKSLI